MPGSATLARNARHNAPLRCTWMRPVVRSDETQKNGFGRSSMRTVAEMLAQQLRDLAPRTRAISGKV